MATLKQKLAIKKTLENGGVVSRAMLEAGYSKAMSKNPQKLTTTKGWAELMEEYLPDDKLMKKVEEGLTATKIHTSHTEPDREVPDWDAQHKFVTTGLKLKGKLKDNADQGNTVNATFNINIDEVIGLSHPTTKTTDSDSDPL